jgi:hypothetical protein
MLEAGLERAAALTRWKRFRLDPQNLHAKLEKADRYQQKRAPKG